MAGAKRNCSRSHRAQPLFSKGVTSVTGTAGRVRHSGGMKQLDIETFHDFSGDAISRRILMEDPVMRVVLVSMRAGQKLPEHAANGLVTVYAVSGTSFSLRVTSPATWFRES